MIFYHLHILCFRILIFVTDGDKTPLERHVTMSNVEHSCVLIQDIFTYQVTSLVVQWLRFHNSGGPGSILGY